MIVDSSALVSVLLREAGHQAVLRKLRGAEIIFVGAPTAVETAIVLSARLGRDARQMIAGLFDTMDAEIVDFSEQHYRTAVAAYLRFGKGRHPAALNFGDCLSYALAAVTGLPLLYAGNDFSRTDVHSAQ
jgi:ribonuclease VapC